MRRRLVFWIALAGFLNAAVNTGYATYMVFYVLAPENHVGPLFDRAVELASTTEGFQHLMLRRAYATEAWQTIFQMFVFSIVMAVVSPYGSSGPQPKNPISRGLTDSGSGLTSDSHSTRQVTPISA